VLLVLVDDVVIGPGPVVVALPPLPVVLLVAPVDVELEPPPFPPVPLKWPPSSAGEQLTIQRQIPAPSSVRVPMFTPHAYGLKNAAPVINQRLLYSARQIDSTIARACRGHWIDGDARVAQFGLRG
jgi:hypothetical protein